MHFEQSISVNVDGGSDVTSAAKLLRELQQQAEDNITGSIRLNDCDIDVVIHKHLNALWHDVNYAIVYKVNGKQCRIDVNITEIESRDPHTVAEKLVDALAKDIAINVLGKHLTQAVLNAKW